MRLGLMLGYAGRKIELPMEMIKEADRLGYYSLWSAEAYGSDAVVPLAWIGPQTEQIKLGTAIMQMPGRSPANTAMTAMSFNQLSGGRFLLGLGLSGPQVAEGWHGQGYKRPLTRSREYVDIVRKVFKREEKVSYDGKIYQLPYTGEGSMNLGIPLKSTLTAEPDIPIYLASIGPKNVALTAEIADGWLPIFFSPERYKEVYEPHVQAGFAKGGKDGSYDNFDIAPNVFCMVSDNLDVAYNMLRPFLALYIGGMGAKGKNFYNELACRYGYEEAAGKIQDLYLSGRQAEAMMAVPNELIDEVALVGSRDRIKDRLQRWTDSDITTMNISTFDVNTVQTMAELVL